MSIALNPSTAESARETWRGWLPLPILPTSVFAFFPGEWPRWGLMWSLALAIYLGCKWLTWRNAPTTDAPIWKHLAYLLAWPGLDASAFLGCGAPPAKKPALFEWTAATAKFAFGAVLFFAVARFVPTRYPLVIGWVGMIGLVMMLHFGLFHVLSCGWRTIGVPAAPIMNRPLVSQSVSEFWGRRWNTAFRDLTYRFLFRPLAARFGAEFALALSFFVSGLIHDLVISAPAGAGYGGPTMFFMFQGLAIFFTNSTVGRRLRLNSGVTGWLFTAVVLLGPVGWLFHRPFALEIVLPFMRAAGAI